MAEDLDLVLEAFEHLTRGEPRANDLKRDDAVWPVLFGLEDRAHSALADFPKDAIPTDARGDFVR